MHYESPEQQAYAERSDSDSLDPVQRHRTREAIKHLTSMGYTITSPEKGNRAERRRKAYHRRKARKE